MQDRLVWLLERFPLRASTFQTGALGGAVTFEPEPGVGHLHLLNAGSVVVGGAGQPEIQIDQPSAFLYFCPAHYVISPGPLGAHLICATFEFGLNRGNPLAAAIPDMYLMPRSELSVLDGIQHQLYTEAHERHCGSQAILDRLMEVVLVLLLRDLMDSKRMDVGLMAGLSDVRLHKTLNALHESPAEPWTIERMASKAGMSRARFAEHFHRVVGATPADYLADWRLGLAENYLIEGKSVGQTAIDVGYASSSAFSRAFSDRRGLSPKNWIQQYREGAASI